MMEIKKLKIHNLSNINSTKVLMEKSIYYSVRLFIKDRRKVDIIGPFVEEIQNIIYLMTRKYHLLKKYAIKMLIFLCIDYVINDFLCI